MSPETYSFINMLLLSLLSFIAMIVITILSYWGSMVNRKLEAVQKSELAIANALTKLQEWSTNHDKQDDERHEDSRMQIGALSEVLHGMDQAPTRVASGGRRRRQRGGTE